MMNGFWQRIYDPRLIIAAGIVVVLVCAYRILSPIQFWSLMSVLLGILLVAGLIWWYLKRKNSQQGAELVNLLQQDNRQASPKKTGDEAEKIQFLKQQMNDSIRTLRKSRLGDKRGHAALYELPWYMMIGNPAAGKSSAIQNSGLRFPFAENNKDKAAIQGIGGTRNCDWFFSTEGILLDTAGRYAIYEEDHQEWLGFLGLLKKNRKKAPINGIIIGVSIDELMSNNP
jgi:type VI secretion system protein ImpL